MVQVVKYVTCNNNMIFFIIKKIYFIVSVVEMSGVPPVREFSHDSVSKHSR